MRPASALPNRLSMRLTLIQSALHWEKPAANRSMFAEKLAALSGRTDLVVLPEMFTTGFSMQPEQHAEPFETGATLAWMAEQAQALDAAVAGSFMCQSGDAFFNRFVFMHPDGHFQTYDKRHLFALAGEHAHYQAGEKKCILTYMGHRICPMICYDLRFPVWSRMSAEFPYEMLIYVANWPSRRAHHWKALLAARAIENQAFVAGVNMFGTDGAGLEYGGDSAVIDFSGQVIGQISGQEGVFTTELSFSKQAEYRGQLPFLQDADLFELKK